MKARRDEVTPRVAILSGATRAAIEAIGGLELAETVTTARRSQLSRCQSGHEGDTLSLRDAEALDSAGVNRGGPHILRTLASLLDHVIIPIPPAAAGHDEISAMLMAVTIELGDVATEIRDARGDGQITPREAMAVIAQVDDLLAAGASLRGMMQPLAGQKTHAGGRT